MVVGAWAFWTAYVITRDLQSIVEREFERRTNGVLQVSDISWHWGYIDFTAVSVDAPILPGVITVKRVRVHLAARAAARRDLLAAIRRVEFVAPTLEVDQSVVERLRRWRTRDKPTTALALPEIEFVVGEGSIRYRRISSETPVLIATGISGWIRPRENVEVSLSGRLLSKQMNLSLAGTFPLDDSPPRLVASAKSIHLAELDTYLAGTPSGTADLTLALTDTLTATAELRQAEYLIGDSLNMGPINARVTVLGNEARWVEASLPLNGINLTTEGRVLFGDIPSIQATAHWAGDVDRLGHLLSRRLTDLHGNVSGEIDLTGNLYRPMVEFAVRSDSMSASGVEARDLLLKGHSRQSEDDNPMRLILDDMAVSLPGVRVNGTGEGTLRPFQVDLQIDTTVVSLARLPRAREVGISGRAQVSGQVTIEGREFTAQLQASDVVAKYRNKPIPITQVAVFFDSSRVLAIQTDGPAVSTHARVITDTLGHSLVSGMVRFSGYTPPLGRRTTRLTGAILVNTGDSTVNVEGDLTASWLSRVGRKQSQFAISATKGIRGSTLPLTIDVETPALRVTRMETDAHATITRENETWGFRGGGWNGHLRFAGRASAADDFSTLIVIDKAPAREAALNAKLEKFITAGSVRGRLKLRKSPRSGLSGEGEFDLENATMRNVDSLVGHVNVEVTSDSVRWETGPIARFGRFMAFTSGSYDLTRRIVDTEVWGPPGGRIEEGLALGGVPRIADGDALWSFKIYDNQRDTLLTRFDIEVLATNGSLVHVPFDTTRIHMVGDPRWFHLESGYLSKTNEYTAVSEGGRIPVTAPGGEFDIPVRIRKQPGNDVLSLLTNLINMGVEGHGEGEGYLRVAGPPSEVVIGEGWLELRNGTLNWPGNIWPQWRDLNARASVKRGERFLGLESFDATVGEGRVSVSNSPALDVGGEPLTIDVIGLSLGVLQIVTPKAIPLHIDGGMPEGEVVQLNLYGNDRVQQFTIAGPWTNPLFVGQVEASNGYFTYPLEGEDSDSISAGEQFIASVDWQIGVVVGHNLSYETRSMKNLWQSLIGDPIELLGSMAAQMEARLTEGGRIHLSGIYADNSLDILTENLISEQARLSVLDIDFSPDGPLVLDWDTRIDPEPLIKGRGVAVIDADDNPDAPISVQRIYARLVSVDPVTGIVREGGRLGELSVELDTDDVRSSLSGQERQLAILAMLGYYNADPRLGGDPSTSDEQTGFDPRELVNAGYRTILRRSEQQAWRSIFYPFRRQIRRLTRIDVVDVRPSLILNVLDRDLIDRAGLSPEQAYLAYLHGTNWTVGEYFWGRFLLSYHGELELVSLSSPSIGARHQLAVEWAVSSKTRLALSRDIDVPVGEPDTRIGISHRFAFQSY
jgi:hypothetical protein